MVPGCRLWIAEIFLNGRSRRGLADCPSGKSSAAAVRRRALVLKESLKEGLKENLTHSLKGGAQVLKTLLHLVPRERAHSEKAGTWRAATPIASRASSALCTSICAVLVLLLFTSFAAAQTLTGKVKNSTTGKPSAGDEVIVFKLGQGMEESGRTKTDAAGQFSFKLDDAQAPHLVRAIHQGVTYHRVALPGTTSVAMEVCDVAKRIEGIQVVADIMRIQMAQGHILVTRNFGVRNSSNPPRTQMNERNLEFYVPDHAHIIGDSATATGENGRPVKSAPVPEREKDRYSFIFPLRPGFTHFEVAYQLPYGGSANLDPKSIYPLRSFVVILPKAMQFHAAAGSTGFKLMNYPNQPDATVRVTANTRAGQNLGFSISGEGALETGQENGPQRSGERQGNVAGSAARVDSNNRPGGLGPPIDTRDPLQKCRWWILGGSAAVLLIGGVYVRSRQRSRTRAFKRKKGSSFLLTAMQKENKCEPVEAGTLQTTRAHDARHTSTLMEGIKEELFHIEVECKQGQISQAEYEKDKAALEQTLDRALKREAQKA
jgi:hypothetical protein